MDHIQELFAERIGGVDFGLGTEIFKFEKIKRAKRLAVREHPEMKLIDLGVGESDSRADDAIIKVLNEQAFEWNNRGYADNGILEFQKAAGLYMENVFGVRNLKPESEILHVMGSKSALAMLPHAFINPGDITLLTVPGYPIIGTMTEWLGGEVYKLPLKKENKFLPNLKEIPEDIIKRTKLLYINYPNNPTGSVATKEFFEEVIRFAKKNNIIIIQDAAYAALTFKDQKPLSILSIPEGKEVGIELHSLSKAFSMTGWRLGFACGNEKVITALGAVKDNHDSGQFKAIQHAGIYALDHPEITRSTCEIYERRHQKISKVLQEIGFQVNVPKASFYQYAEIPYGTKEGIRFRNSEEFSEYLIKNALISTIPWDDAGHFVRFSVTFVAKDIVVEDKVIEEIRRRLTRLNLLFN